MDPLSLTSLTAGLVSLGLQVTGGILTYLDGLKNQSKELKSIRRLNEALRATIDVAQAVLNQVPAQNQQLQAAGAQCIDHCTAELVQLEILIASFAGTDRSDWQARLRHKTNQLFFPFDREKVQQLADRLVRANSVLSLALQTSGLDIAQHHSQKLANMDASTTAITTGINSVHTLLADVQNNTLPVVMDQLVQVHRVVDLHTAGITAQMLEIKDDLRRDIQRLHIQAHADRKELIEHFAIVQTQLKHKTRESEIISAAVPNAKVRTRKSSKVQEAKKTTGGSRKFRSRLNEGIQNPETIVSSKKQDIPELDSLCTCRRLRRVIKPNSFRLGGLMIYHETRSQKHWPGCPLDRVTNLDGQDCEPNIAMSIASFLRTAVSIWFGHNPGYHALSFDKRVAYYPTVDKNTAPAFRIIVATSGFVTMRGQWTETNTESAAKAVKLAVHCLSRLFLEGKASPNAVTERNQSLLHIWIRNMRAWIPITMPAILLPLTQALVQLGNPLNSFDMDGSNPFSLALGSLNNEIRSFLLDAAPEITVNQPGEPGSCESTVSINSMQRSSAVAEAFGCGLLSHAILRNDAESVKEIVLCRPSTYHEVNSFGQTPLHLAASSSKLLEILLAQAGAKSVLDATDNTGATALDVALSYSTKNCRSKVRPRRLCSRCHCAKGVAMLLKAGCLFGTPLDYHYAVLASARARRRYLRHFRDQRLALTKHAFKSIPSITSFLPGLSEQAPLDLKLKDVEKLLVTRGIVVPEAMRMRDAGSLPVICSGSGLYSHHYLDLPTTEELFRLGFRDTEAAWGSHAVHALPEKLIWLTQQNDSLLWPYPSQADSEVTTSYFSRAHVISESLGYRISWENHRQDYTEIYSIVQKIPLVDTCRCPCSPGGCSTISCVAKGLLQYSNGPPASLIDLMTDHYKDLLEHITASSHHSMVRAATFKALNLAHTCCDLGMSRYATEDQPDEPLEVHEVETLERVLAELNLHHFPDDRDVMTRLAFARSFWGIKWKNAIRRALGDLDKDTLTDEERRQAEAIGVKWLPHKPRQTAFEALELYYQQMEEIVPEYVGSFLDG